MSGTAQLMEIAPKRVDDKDVRLSFGEQPRVYHVSPPMHGCDHVWAFVAHTKSGDTCVAFWRSDRHGVLHHDPERPGRINQVMVDRVWDVTEHAEAFAQLGYKVVH